MLVLGQLRQKTAAEVAKEEEALRKEADKLALAGSGGGDEGVEAEDAFLVDFVRNRRWLEPILKETPR